jgi:hypothetical protein
VGVNNIRMALDCDVVLGGFLAQFMEPYMPRLKGYAAELNPFESDAEYLRLGSAEGAYGAAGRGAAFYKRVCGESV